MPLISGACSFNLPERSQEDFFWESWRGGGQVGLLFANFVGLGHCLAVLI